MPSRFKPTTDGVAFMGGPNWFERQLATKKANQASRSSRNQDLVFVRDARIFADVLLVRIARVEHALRRCKRAQGVMKGPPFEVVAKSETASFGNGKTFTSGNAAVHA